MKVKYNLIHKDENSMARLGTLETNYGTYDTPMFMPVGTKATVKLLTPEELYDRIFSISCNIGEPLCRERE